MKKIKRIFLIFISVCIFGITIYTDYQSVKAFDIPTAFWGTLEAARAFWTALNAGGGVRGGGVSMSAFEHSSREDMHNLQVQVMLAYTAFCIWKEKQQLSVDHPDWSEEEINQEAETKGRLDSARFQNDAIDVNDSTRNLTLKDFGYWKEFCDELHEISLHGGNIGSSEILPDTVIVPQVINADNNTQSFDAMQTLGENTLVYDNNNYIYKYQWYRQPNNVINYENGTIATDRVRIPFCTIRVRDNYYVDNYLWLADVNILTQEIITVSRVHYIILTNAISYITNIIANTSCPIIYSESADFDPLKYLNEVGYEVLRVNQQSGNAEEYQELIKNALDNTEAGKAIKEGVANGQEEIVKEGYIPVKRSSVKTGEETATGAIGWDVPDARTLEGAIAVPDTQDDVVTGMGIITVPKDKATPKTDDTTVEWAKDEPISIPDIKDEPISVPIDDVISEQYGDYYPTQIALGDFFPFCIPFDIYYCVQKFNVSQGEAPVIHIPIVYPRALQGILGESYDVVIDFNNYISLRNIIRFFVLLFFIVGLMLVTRNLIRG